MDANYIISEKYITFANFGYLTKMDTELGLDTRSESKGQP